MNTLSNKSLSLACYLMSIPSDAREECGTAVAKFIEHERFCCPFFHLGLPWPRSTGGEGVKDILQTTLFESLIDKVALKQLIQTSATAIIMKQYPTH